MRPIEPREGQTIDSSLTAILRWTPQGVQTKYRLVVSSRPDLGHSIVDVQLNPQQTSYRTALRPETKYYWRIAPIGSKGPQSVDGFYASFTTGKTRIDTTADDGIRYQNPRPGAHFLEMDVVKPGVSEPLSPWYGVKKYAKNGPPPTFTQIRSKLPDPIWEGHPEAIDTYWYCWKTFCDVWSYAPKDSDHQAVANLVGIPSWGPWGSTMVWDTAFINYFTRYGNAGYPFVEAFDNMYARQHDNGFICRESDRENREVYVVFPVNPPLFSWAEWENFEVTGDKKRLAEVFLPIVKQYEWYMTYQRRANGLYWTSGVQEADDSPRNGLMYYAASATSQQALAALYLARIARTINRKDMAEFFETQHADLGKMVNEHFWDRKHKIYNDLTQDMRFITELEPGKFCKHCHMFWPMLAEIAPPDRVDGLVAELSNPASFFRPNGVPSLSADSSGYTGGPDGDGTYWRGSVWPPIQCMVQEGLRAVGQRELARKFAVKYLNAVIGSYTKQKDITEFLAPDRLQGYGNGQFVGWGGIGPVADLIEYELGFEVDAPAKKVTWRITQAERHGIQKLSFANASADLICEHREKTDAPCRITVSSTGTFTLVVVTSHGKHEKRITKGVHKLTLN